MSGNHRYRSILSMLEWQGIASREEEVAVEVQEKNKNTSSNNSNNTRDDIMCSSASATQPQQDEEAREPQGKTTAQKFSNVRQRRRALLRRHQRNPAVVTRRTRSTPLSEKDKVLIGVGNHASSQSLREQHKGDITFDTSMNTCFNTTLSEDDMDLAPPPIDRRARKADTDEADPVPQRRTSPVSQKPLNDQTVSEKERTHHHGGLLQATPGHCVDRFLVIKGRCNHVESDEELNVLEKRHVGRASQGAVDPVFVPRQTNGDYPEDEGEDYDEEENEDNQDERNDNENSRDPKGVHKVRVNVCSNQQRDKVPTKRIERRHRKQRHDDDDDEDVWESLGSALWKSMDCRSFTEVLPMLMNDHEVKIYKYRRSEEYRNAESGLEHGSICSSTIGDDSAYDGFDDMSTIPEQEDGQWVSEFWQDAELRGSCGLLQAQEDDLTDDGSVRFVADFSDESTLLAGPPPTMDPAGCFPLKELSENVTSAMQSGQSSALVKELSDNVASVMQSGRSSSLLKEVSDNVTSAMQSGQSSALVKELSDNVTSVMQSGRSSSLLKELSESITSVMQSGRSSSLVDPKIPPVMQSGRSLSLADQDITKIELSQVSWEEFPSMEEMTKATRVSGKSSTVTKAEKVFPAETFERFIPPVNEDAIVECLYQQLTTQHTASCKTAGFPQ
eukprot:scaffold34620_cov160-Amphora_coffeaeformis.AAC.12